MERASRRSPAWCGSWKGAQDSVRGVLVKNKETTSGNTEGRRQRAIAHAAAAAGGRMHDLALACFGIGIRARPSAG